MRQNNIEKVSDYECWCLLISKTAFFLHLSFQMSVSDKAQKVHFRDDSYGGSSGYSSLGSNKGGGARPKLTIPTVGILKITLTFFFF